jgi:DNA-binding NarL/FixJ family response regulator
MHGEACAGTPRLLSSNDRMDRERHPGPLLIIDDRDDVRSGLRRFFGLFFERVVVAANPAEAEEGLATAEPPFVLCDYWLGNEHPPSTELIPGWRARFPCIRVLALMTGTKAAAIQGAVSVDAIFQKPLDLYAVKEFFFSFVEPVTR